MQFGKWLILSAITGSLAVAGGACKSGGADDAREPMVSEGERTGTTDVDRGVGVDQATRTNAERERDEATGQPNTDRSTSDPGTHDHSRPHEQQLAMEEDMSPDADASAQLSALDQDGKMRGLVQLLEEPSGTRLIIHLEQAEPGRYSLYLLERGTCSKLEQKQASAAKRPALAQIEVGQDGRGHMEVTLTPGELGQRTIVELEQNMLVIRDDDPSQVPMGAEKDDDEITACGIIVVPDERAG